MSKKSWDVWNILTAMNLSLESLVISSIETSPSAKHLKSRKYVFISSKRKIQNIQNILAIFKNQAIPLTLESNGSR